MQNYQLKYEKYKEKYIKLKKELNKIQKGGAEKNSLKNILVMGAGPVGLVATLALLKRYNRVNCKDDTLKSQLLEANNIYLLGKDIPYRQQIFFFQNSYRDYDSSDFIRDIDLETFKMLEKIGCYIGSPPSTQKPTCYAYTDGTKMSDDNTSIRAPKSIKLDGVEPEPKPLYLMTHLSFHVSDLESVLLDNIIKYNNENIDFYLKTAELDEFNTKYKKYQNVLNYKDNTLVKALLIKDYLLSKDKITIENFRPIVVLVHPFNKYANISQILLYRHIKNNEDLGSCANKDYVTEQDLNDVGNSMTTKWNLKKEDDGSISFNNPTQTTKEKSFLLSECYDIVFEASASAKQFGRNDDYYCIKNRDRLEISNNVEVKKNLFIGEMLNKNSVITLENESATKDHYVVMEKTSTLTVTNYVITNNHKFDLKKINMGDNDLLNSTLYEEIYEMSINIEIPLCDFKDFIGKNINYVKEIKYDEDENLLEDNDDLKINKIIDYVILKSRDRNTFEKFIYNTQINYGIDAKDNNYFNNTLEQIAYQLYYKYVWSKDIENVIVKKGDGTTCNYNKIFKVNTLKMEETKMELKDNAKNAIVFASVLMIPTQTNKNVNTPPNYLFTNKFLEDRIPLTSDDIPYEYTKEKAFRRRVDYKTMPNQVYINNDRVQYFNSAQFGLDSTTTDRLHKQNYGSNPQHVFRVFGVNTLNDVTDSPIKNENVKRYFEYTTTKKHYYCGIQISSGFNKFIRETLKDNENDNDKKIELIYKILYSFTLVYTQPTIYNDYIRSRDPKKLYREVMKIWNETYGKEKPTIIDFNTPIHKESKSIFPITIKYKKSTIEEVDEKIIFNLGDANTTVNFFSGTGLNTGVSNIRYLLDNYKLNKSQTDSINNNLMKKNRRTIYNSLLSTQNPTYLSEFRLYDNKSIGPFINNPTKKISYDQFKRKLQQLNVRSRGNDINLSNCDPETSSVCNLVHYLNNFETIFKCFWDSQGITNLQNKDDILYELHFNLYTFVYNLYLNNPVLGLNSIGNDDSYKHESITYLNHLIHNYFDFCNKMFTENTNDNKPYYCDILELETDYEPQRTFQFVRTGKLDT
jgi:2-polyprenyl-6-methoxyphenol hydroxylase-like FAD-dependent oxidoreductase